MAISSDLPDDFFTAFIETCTRLDCAPLDLLSVAANESGVRATAHNRNGDASGLWQLMPSTARGLGWDTASDPHLDAFRQLGPVEQLTWFEKYFSAYRHELVSRGACYVATFLPALISHAGDPDFVLCGESGPLAWAYAANRGFDPQRNGVIRVSDLESAIDRACAAMGARWTEIVARLEDLSPSTDATSEQVPADGDNAGVVTQP